MQTLVFAGFFALLINGCGSDPSSGASAIASKSYPAIGSCASMASCPVLTGSPWVPSVSGMSVSNHDSSVTLSRTVLSAPGPVTGLSQPAPASQEITFTFDMPSDLGDHGSLTLEAQVKGFPSALFGNAYPVLVSLSDGAHEFVNLKRSGASGDCANAGYYNCTGSSCLANPGCAPQWPSAYLNRVQWEQHQVTIPATGSDANSAFPSVNTFPTCNWSVPMASSNGSAPGCAFSAGQFLDGSGHLRHGNGVTYTAKYVLLANSYKSLGAYTANIELTITRKQDVAVGGALDLNVILVGTNNVQASRTAQGQRNLDTLFSKVYSYYNQPGTGVKLGAIHPIEFPCDQCGDYYADLPTSDLSYLYQNTASLLSSSTQGQAINLYLTDSLTNSDSDGLTILGLAGAINGSFKQGTPISGVSVAAFEELGNYNSSCTTDPCPDTTLESSFVELTETVAHELGHYLGLNHPSESDGATHDAIDDTPICTALGGSGYISISSCRISDTNLYEGTGNTCGSACPGYNSALSSFCPAAPECQFNHIMWWTTKNWDPLTGMGDGKLFSPHSGLLINYSPYIQ